ncbi:septum site-determining protein MinC [Limnospira fusiformis CCALA 023]|uniref:septum site-determining protein MinC n=1 Tax=Limnospira platensis TaxID=118562 RepID=UPI00396D55FD
MSEETPKVFSLNDGNSQIRFKREGENVLLILPPEEGDRSENSTSNSWGDLLQQLKHRITGEEHSWEEGLEVHLVSENRLLDSRQLQDIRDILTGAKLELKRVRTSRAQTAVAAATAGYSVDRESDRSHLSQKETETERTTVEAEPLYLKMTLRSGVEIRHPGTVVVVGDVNPGSSIVANGDIMIWGRLRGTVHAGAKGNLQSMIMALQMEPMLIRIGDRVARGPENPPEEFYPEVAYMTAKGIRISRATELGRVKLWQISQASSDAGV